MKRIAVVAIGRAAARLFPREFLTITNYRGESQFIRGLKLGKRANQTQKIVKQSNVGSSKAPVYFGTLRLGPRDESVRLWSPDLILPSVFSDSQKTWVLFGDESTAPDIVAYGIVAFHSADQANRATFAFQRTIARAGALPQTRVHCKELYSGAGRAKTGWAHLTESETWVLAINLIETLREHSPEFYLGIVYKDTFPEKIPAGLGKNIELTNEHCYAFGFISAAAAFGSGRAGHRYTLLVDEQSGKAQFWGLGNVQIRRMMEATGLRHEQSNHLLLDAADLFTYSSARALSMHPSRNSVVCKKILETCKPQIAHYWWQEDSTISETMKRRLDIRD